MISEGRRSATEVAGLIEELEKFDPKKVERGTVYVHGLFSSKNVSMSLLYLSPGAKIKEHSNDEYSENYEEVDGNCIEICNKGESHFLENSSTDKWLVIFVVKRK